MRRPAATAIRIWSRGLAYAGLAALLAGTALPGAAIAAPAEPPVAQAEQPRIQQGDLLIANHSFEDGIDGWTGVTGRGCGSEVTDEWADDGAQSLRLAGSGPCTRPEIVSSPVDAVAGEAMTAFVTAKSKLPVSVGISFLDASGEVLATERSEAEPPGDGATLEITATAPDRAAQAAVEIRAVRSALVDNVLITGPATALGPQVRKPMGFLAMGAGVDQDGRAMVASVGTGSAAEPAKIIAADALTGEVTQIVDLPGAVGSWTIEQNPVSKIYYIGTYSSAALWSWKPGETEAKRIGAPPIESFGFMYGLSFGADGTVYGGGWGESTDGYPGASIWKYVEGEGFGTIAPTPLVEDAYYARWTAYDEVTDTVFAGTGTNVHLFGCDASGPQHCTELTDLLSPELQELPWLYNGKASGGYLTIWGGDSNSTGNDYLVILKLSRDADGVLQAEKLTEIKGVAYSGPSDIVDGKVYFNKRETGLRLHSYDLQTGEEQIHDSAPAGIYSRNWEAVDLQHPDWPGTTLVGWDSSGRLVRWNVATERFSSAPTEGIPESAIGVTNLSSGPDGNIWTSGYLTGGLGVVAPMRSDQQATHAVGGQAEGMIEYNGRVYQGTYPYARIESFDPTAGDPVPEIDCEIGEHQNRPYGLYGHGDRIYYGTQAEYGHDEGAFGYLELTTGECTTIPGPLGAQSINAITASGGKVFGGGNIFFSWDGTPTEEQAELLIFDEESGESKAVVWPIPDTRSINAAATSDDGTVWLYAEGWLVAMDPESEQVIMKQEIFPDLKPGDRIAGSYGQMITHRDGRIYGNVGGRVFSFDPAATLEDGSADGSLRVLFEDADAHIASDRYGNIHVPYQSTQLLRLDPRSLP